MRLDGARLFREADVLLTGHVHCVLPKGHEYPHGGERGEIWGPLWAVCDEGGDEH